MSATRGDRAARRGAASAALLVAVTTASMVGVAGAQTNDEVQAGVQFNFSTPGARSLGLGGAFLAAADDATAAYANPAGLAQLVAPEVSIEGRAWTYTSRYAERGHDPPDALTGIGLDTVRGLAEGSRDDRTAALSFLSYTHAGRRWAAAVFRHQLARYEASLASEGPFIGSRTSTARIFPARSRLTLDVAGVGVAGSARLGGGVYVGAAVTRYDFHLDGKTERFYVAEATGDPVADSLTGAHYGPGDLFPANLANTQLQRGDDADLAFTLGLLWRPNARWSLGAVRRTGPEFGFRATFTDGPKGDHPGEVDPNLGGAGDFHVPDSWGLGVAYRPTDQMLIALDWDRVEYSDMGDHLVNLLRAAAGRLDDFRIDDADEVHLGIEYQALRLRHPLAARLGAWLDPGHKLRYTGPSNILRARFRGSSDEVHLAGGIGVVLGRTQIDLAADLSRPARTLSASTVVRF